MHQPPKTTGRVQQAADPTRSTRALPTQSSPSLPAELTRITNRVEMWREDIQGLPSLAATVHAVNHHGKTRADLSLLGISVKTHRQITRALQHSTRHGPKAPHRPRVTAPTVRPRRASVAADVR